MQRSVTYYLFEGRPDDDQDKSIRKALKRNRKDIAKIGLGVLGGAALGHYGTKHVYDKKLGDVGIGKGIGLALGNYASDVGDWFRKL